MALDTMSALDADGLPVTINKIKSGRAAAADSQAVAISNEDLAALIAVGTKLDSAIALIGATNTALAATNAALTTIDGRVDGLETLTGSTNTLLTTQNGYLDTVETLIGSSNTLATTQNGYLDGVEGSLTSILAKIIAAPSTEALQTALNTLVGAQNATAWASGDGTLISLLKAIAAAAVSTTPADVRVAAAEFETVAASVTDQMLGPTGGAGDTLSGLLVIPATTSPGAVSIEYGSTNITVFAGGTDSVSSLIPFFVPLENIASVGGGWEVTTGANVSVIAFGNFT